MAIADLGSSSRSPRVAPLAALLALGCTGVIEGGGGVCLEPERVDEGESVSKVAGGVETDADWAVVGILGTDGELFCTGTLVGERVVLTAAHCIDGEEPETLEVHFGPTADEGARVGVLASVIHPDYQPRPVYQNDLGLLLLAGVVPRELASPVPLAACLAGPLDGAELRIIGFGQLDADDEGSARKRTGWGSVSVAEPTTFTTRSTPAQPCNGDSGGPALIRSGGREYLAGIVSHGDGACERYASYTRVDAFYDSFIVYYLDPSDEE